MKLLFAVWLSAVFNDVVLAQAPGGLTNAKIACEAVGLIVNLIKVNQVTTYCSSLLGIATKTLTTTAPGTITAIVTIPGTTTTVIDYTSTSTVISTLTSTVSMTLSTTQTTTDTVSQTSTQTKTTTSTSTIYYHLDGAPVKRAASMRRPAIRANVVDPHVVEPRLAPPIILAPFASPVILAACSCLGLRIPSKTVTVTQTSTTSTTASPITKTEKSVKTTSTRSTITVTSTRVTTITMSTVNTASATFTVTVTSTATRSVPAACTSEPPNNYPFPNVIRPRAIQGRFSGGTRLECCIICYQTQNCILYAYFFEPGTCYTIFSTDQLTTGVTDYCPLGISPDSQISNDTNDPGFGGYQVGPCNIGAPI